MTSEGDLKNLTIDSDRAHSEFVPRISHITSSPAINYHESGIATSSVLGINHNKNHCFFNDRGFHNHIVHHILALYSLGATPEFIKEAFQKEDREQRPISTVKDFEFDSESWTKNLGKEEYYGNYLKFFKEEIKENGAVETVERYVFKKSEGELFNRSMAGLLHPIIHWGYGLEFNLDAIVAEGLAIAAVHPTWLEGLELHKLLEKFSSQPHSNGAGASIRKPDLEIIWPDSRRQFQTKTYKLKLGLTSFEIISEIIKDGKLGDIGHEMGREDFNKTSNSSELKNWLDQWKIDPDADKAEIFQRTQEIIWLATVLYATSFDEQRKVYNLNFGVMHLVTASIFLPTVLSVLSPELRPALLTAYFKVAVVVWVTIGKPKLQLTEVMLDAHNLKIPESENPLKGENSWYKVLSSAAKHPDEHVTKIIRTFEFAARTYGSTPKGYYSSSLEGTDLLDSTIFLRAAIMTLNKNDWEVDSEHRQFKWFL